MSFLRQSAVAWLCLLSLPPLRAEEPRKLQYDIRPGDHLIYRQTLEREVSGTQLDSSSRHTWTTHLTVVDVNSNAFIVGMQRNRTSFDLLRFRLNGQDRLKQTRKETLERLSQLPPYAEANRFDPRGWLQMYPQVVRESGTKVLFDLREILPLPASGSVRLGDKWEVAGLIPTSFTAAAWEEIDNESCLRVDGTSSAAPELNLHYWFCADSGLLKKMEVVVAYPAMSGGTTREKLVLELAERRRSEAPASWLNDPEARHGMLAALLVSDTLPIATADLYAALEQPDADVQRRILGLAYRRRLPPPGIERLTALFASTSLRVRALAVRMLEQHGKEAARPLIARALADSDEFVRRAAFRFIETRLPARDVLAARTAEQALARWEQLTDSPVLEAEARSASAPGGGPSAAEPSTCNDTALWSETVRRQRSTWQPVGTTPQVLDVEGFRGWPYLVRVPEDYRGDEPFPLLIYLSGNSGPAIEGALLANEGVADTSYIVVYPHANGFWWHSKPTAMVSALLDDVLRRFNVDTRRIYLTGLSNGGTGALYYATLWPHRFAAAVSAMGAGLLVPELEPDSEPLPRNSDHLPLLFLHGAEDPVISADATRETVERMSSRPAPLESHIFPERGHEIIIGRGDDGMTLDFFRFERNPFPRALNYQARTLRAPRLYWVEMLEKEPGLAEVKAEIEKNNVIRLNTRRVRRLRLLLRPEMFPTPGPVRVLLNGKEVFSGELPGGCTILERSLQQTLDPLLAWSSELIFEVPN
ncbi:MAG: dienelactone hydrolase family protein [Terriglobales bacterium]